MTWYAVPNDVVGGWAVANRQAPMSELDTRLHLRPEDVRVDIYSTAPATGATHCARVTHLPTGLVGESEGGPSRIRERETAMANLLTQLPPPADVVIADGVKSEADARRIAAGLNRFDSIRDAEVKDLLVVQWSEPWPGAEVEG